jgi:hydroxymethylbilane synthase
VKEIEDALLNREIDLAVHSSKDMPAVLPEGLAIAGVLPREDPHDAVVLAQGPGTRDQGLETPGPVRNIEELRETLGPTPSIGTSSVRRIAQLKRLFPGGRFSPIRGNLDTRLRKLDGGGNAALVLAAAGLRRLGFDARISWRLPSTLCVPAPGQGIIAMEIRDGDDAVRAAVSTITDPAAWAALSAERAVVEALGGGCQIPIGALASPDGHTLDLLATVISLDGDRAVFASARGTWDDAATLGKHVAGQLMSDGAGEILEEVRRQH